MEATGQGPRNRARAWRNPVPAAAKASGGTTAPPLQNPSKIWIDFGCVPRTPVNSANRSNCRRQNALAPEVARHQQVRVISKLSGVRRRRDEVNRLHRRRGAQVCHFCDRLRWGFGLDGTGRPGTGTGTGTGTTANPSMPVKSFGLQVYNGSPFARAVAAIITS